VRSVFLHIGAPKCASSLIQGLLNEPDSKEIVPLRYMDDLSKLMMSYSPVFDFSDPFTQANFGLIRDALPDEDMLFSCENLFGVHTHRNNSCHISAEVLRFLFKGYDLKVMFYVRRQDTYLASLYGQDVKRGETRPFEDYLQDCNLLNLNWLDVADTYSEFDLTVLPFEKSVIQTGGYRDFIDGLYQWMGERVVVENLPHINPSLSPAAREVQRYANHMLPKQEAYDLSLWMENHCRKRPEDKHDITFDTGGFREVYGELNEKLFEKYLPGFDGTYYGGDDG
jgi:hypothetical protein